MSKLERGKDNPTALQIVVYDMKGKHLPEQIIHETLKAVQEVVKQYEHIAHTAVVE